ncbi:hypothetical protein [uncultured Erythrobacter sp.]|uniref:hypothetical protein n=1 Tax=uncultured Erythrobacter sp. TaxID=263913 RepID=UPI00261E8852|nr:hypothetical protein [uncultured Erythrobacter sp.]
MARSVAIIGAGQIGFAAAAAFLSDSWDVRVCARSRPDWLQAETFFQRYLLGEDPAPDADLVLDTIAFDAEDIARYSPDAVSHLIAVSSASVYCDAQGRSLDEAATNGFPEFDGPLSETQNTVAPGPETYSTRKVRMEKKARELFGDCATILRPCAIHGPHSRHPREWWFVKRILDGRQSIPLAHNGNSMFHTTSADTIASFAVHVANNKLAGVFNVCDDFPPTVLQIGETIARILEREIEFLRLEGSQGLIGRTPWSVPLPFLVSGERAGSTGFADALPYDAESDDAVRWLADTPPTDWRTAFPQLAAYPWDLFDYEAEDRFFASL